MARGRPSLNKEVEGIETPESTNKHTVIPISQYYEAAGKVMDQYPGLSKRDVALALLHDEYAERIVREVNDMKSGDIKFVVLL